MKKFLITASITLMAASVTVPSHALSSQHKQELSFGGSAIVGALLGGPVGYVIGAASGAFMADQIKQADSTTTALQQLEQRYQQVVGHAALSDELLHSAASDIEQLQASLALKAKMPLFFTTNSNELSAQEFDKLAHTIEFLEADTRLFVELNGYADPRGADRYNEVLSSERAEAVKQALIANGISAHRIIVQGHGGQAQSHTDHAYSLARRVEINFEDRTKASLVMH